MRFTHNGHHHCKKTSPPAIKKLMSCRPADISPALFLTVVLLFDNWRAGMVVTDGPASADLHWTTMMTWAGRFTLWHHQMEIFSALLALCAGNSPVTGESSSQTPVTRSFDVFFDLRLNKRLSKQSWGWWLETTSRSLWRRCNDLRT